MRGRLASDALAVEAALKSAPGTRACGGAALPVTVGGGARPVKDGQAAASVLSSDNRRLTFHVVFPVAKVTGRQGGGKDFVQLHMDGVGIAGAPGEPGIPTLTQFFAVPVGADIKVSTSNLAGYTLKGVDLFPRQPNPVDKPEPPGRPDPSVWADKPFAFSKEAYARAGPFPASPSRELFLGTLRDARIGGAEFAAAQYNPRAHTVTVFTSMDVTVDFAGDNKGHFADSRVKSPWNVVFDRIYRSGIANYDVFQKYLLDVPPIRCGEELLIITSPALRPAADTLAVSRSAAGYFTHVKEVGSGPGQIGTTNTQIQSYIRSRLNGRCYIRPSYLILLGNTANVPTFNVPCSSGGDPATCDIASDLPYAQDGLSADLFADIAYGRIPAPDLTTASTVVNKIITYETSAPSSDPAFYSNATVTSFFQGTDSTDDRGFTKTSETVRNAMIASSHTVERIYESQAADPQFYYDGTPLPAALLKPGFPWDGDTTDFINAFNAGRFLILHRDHGWPGGWASPTLTEGDIPSLTNGTKLPVVFGINCASAQFDVPADPSFVEGLLQSPVGGAVGGFGDTRNSPSFPNNHMTLGFFDALFPNVAPAFGSMTPLLRMGDVLLAGKQYMATQEGIDWQSAGDTYQEHYLYGYLGDPTMQLWMGQPHRFDPSKIKLVLRERKPTPGDPPLPPGDPPPFEVLVEISQPGADGAIATLMLKDEAIGRGIVRNGQVLIPNEVAVKTDGLSLSLEQDTFIAAQLKVQGALR